MLWLRRAKSKPILRRGKESNNSSSARSRTGICVMQEAAMLESSAAEKEQPCKDSEKKEEMFSSLLFSLSAILGVSFPYVERCLIDHSSYNLRRHKLRY